MAWRPWRRWRKVFAAFALAAHMASAGAPPIPLRVNCGGSEVTDGAGLTWEADAPYRDEAGWGHLGGRASQARPGAGMAGAAPGEEPLLLSDRWGFDAYLARVPPGVYRVTLLFSEYHFDLAGRRVFDLRVNGRTVAGALDIVARAGTNGALRVTTLVRAGGDGIRIETSPIVDQGKLGAFAIEPAERDAVAPPTPGAPRVHARLSGCGVEWDPVAAEDLDGYRVYRRAGEGGAFERAFAEIVTNAWWCDEATASAACYRVSAVDLFGNESEPGPAADAAPYDPAAGRSIAIDVAGAGGGGWGADQAYNPANGAGWESGGHVVTNADAGPFGTAREGNWAYRLDLPPGVYQVTLLMQERGDAQPWDRVFDVYLNEWRAWTGLDLAALGEAGRATERSRLYRVGSEGLRVRAEGRHGRPLLHGLRVEPATADTEPPAAPAGVTIEARDEVVHLAWDPSSEPDVIGYQVLRAADRPLAFVPQTNGLVGRASFVDRRVRNGMPYHYQVLAVDAGGRESAASATVSATPAIPDDEQLLDLVQRAAFRYFERECDPRTFLTRDKSTAPEISVAAVGFGLAAHVVGAERGWMPRDEARRRVERMLEALRAHPDNRYEGMFFHYLDPDGSTTIRGYENGASTVDTALLVWGALSAGEYFGGRSRELADDLAAGVNWRAFADPARRQLRMIYRPATGAFDGHWDYYTDEILLMTLLGIGAPRPEHRLEPEYFYSFRRERKTYAGIADIVCTWPGALFTYLFAHAWIDFRALGPERPQAMGLPAEGAVDWWENSVKAARANRAYCLALARRYRTFGEHAWGLTASSGPGDTYVVAGAPPCGDSANPAGGTLAPYGAGMAVPVLPAEATAALRHYYTMRDESGRKRLWRDEFDGGYGLIDAFNLDRGWFSPEVQAINHGPMLLLIENHRSGLLWRVTLRHPIVRDALQRVGWVLPPG